MAKIDDRVAHLEAKLKEAKAQKAALEQRQRALDAKKGRADDTRRKVLLGALMLDLWEHKKGNESELRKELDGFLNRPGDRALFGLSVETTSNPDKAPSNGGDQR